jgi:hypothetical protein
MDDLTEMLKGTLEDRVLEIPCGQTNTVAESGR